MQPSTWAPEHPCHSLPLQLPALRQCHSLLWGACGPVHTHSHRGLGCISIAVARQDPLDLLVPEVWKATNDTRPSPLTENLSPKL